MQGRSEEYGIIDAWADVSSGCESLKGMSERVHIIILILHLSVSECVHESGRLTEAIRPEIKTNL